MEPALRAQIEAETRAALEGEMRAKIQVELERMMKTMFQGQGQPQGQGQAQAQARGRPITGAPAARTAPPGVQGTRPPAPVVQQSLGPGARRMVATPATSGVQPRRMAPTPSQPAVLPRAAVPARRQTSSAGGGETPHERAQRLARVIVSDVLLYNADLIEKAVKVADPKQAIGDVWKEAVEYYETTIAADVRRGTNYLDEALDEAVQKLRVQLGMPGGRTR
jgi:hypothetical protein